MPRTSAGIILYRIRNEIVEYLLVHPGGPLWANKDEGAWSIPKGEFDSEAESGLEAAIREFEEELGAPVPDGPRLPLGQITQRSGKVVLAWAVEGDLDESEIHSNIFTLEWPRGSGRIAEWPEVDRAEWFYLEDARRKLNPAQVELVVRLDAQMTQAGTDSSPP